MDGYDEVDGSSSDNTGEDSDSTNLADRYKLFDGPEPGTEDLDYWDYRMMDAPYDPPPRNGVYPNRKITVEKLIDFNGDFQRHTITAEPMFNHYMDVLTSMNNDGQIYNQVLEDPTVRDHGLVQIEMEIGMEKPGDDGLGPVRDSFHIRSNPVRRLHGEDYVDTLKRTIIKRIINTHTKKSGWSYRGIKNIFFDFFRNDTALGRKKKKQRKLNMRVM